MTGQMHGTVLLDGAGQAGAPRRTLAGPPSRGPGAALGRAPAAVRARLGGPFSPGLTGPVLGWLAEHEPQALRAASRVVLPKDFVRGVLTATAPDALVTDPSDASGTLLWDVGAAAWSAEAAAAARADAALLPDVVPADREVGSTRGVPVVAGAGDTPASLVALERALGGWRPGDLVVNLGTGAQVIEPGCRPPGRRPAGRVARLRRRHGRLLRDGRGAQRRARRSAGPRPGSGSAGATSRPPSRPSRPARAAWCSGRSSPRNGARCGPPCPSPPGWVHDAGATEAQLARAAAEAQVFLVRRARELLGVTGERVFLVGGGGREAWVQQLVADALGRPVTRLEIRSAAALGAAALAAGPGLRLPTTQETVEPLPNPALDAAYERWTARLLPGR